MDKKVKVKNGERKNNGNTVTFILKIDGGYIMGWADTLQEVPHKTKVRVKRGFEDEAVVDDLMENRPELQSEHNMREYNQKVIHLGKQFTTLIDKFEMAGLDNQTGIRYRNQMREVIMDLEDVISKLKGEVK